jgi:hypothetical protein
MADIHRRRWLNCIFRTCYKYIYAYVYHSFQGSRDRALGLKGSLSSQDICEDCSSHGSSLLCHLCNVFSVCIVWILTETSDLRSQHLCRLCVRSAVRLQYDDPLIFKEYCTKRKTAASLLQCALATICLHHSWAQYPVPFEPKVVSCPEYPTGDMYTPLRCLVSDFLLILHTNNKLQTVSLWINAFVSVRIILRLVEYSKGLGSSNSRQIPFHSNTGGYSSYCMLK